MPVPRRFTVMPGPVAAMVKHGIRMNMQVPGSLSSAGPAAVVTLVPNGASGQVRLLNRPVRSITRLRVKSVRSKPIRPGAIAHLFEAPGASAVM